jgi:hypothetical protein
MQLVSVIQELKFSIPTLFSAVNYVSNPVENTMTSLDCAFANSNTPIVYLRVIWALLLPIIYCIFIYLIYLFLCVVKLIGKPNKLYVIAGLIFTILYCQPGLLSAIILTISC